MTDPTESLKELWASCFPPSSWSSADRRAEGEERWSQQRARHLPWTLEVMTEKQPHLRYGQEEQQQGEATLLLMAGYSPEQLALVIAAHAAKGCARVVPFTGGGVWAAVQEEVVSGLGLLGAQAEILTAPVEVDPGSPADVFRKLARWIQEHPGARCAIDCTGGKKPMDSGAAHAASFYGLPAYYLDFGGYHPQLRRPLPWTCRYGDLPLPDVAFGLGARRRVLEAFRARRFREAHLECLTVLEQARRSGMLNQAELEDLEQALRLTEDAAAWLELRYHEMPSGHPLAGTFAAPDMDPRGMVESLLEPARFQDLFCYLADEYWRLALQREVNEPREALVGLVGLAEVVADAMLRAPWSQKTHMTRAEPREWLSIERSSLPDLEAWKGQDFPIGCLPPSSFTEKVKLLRRGRATFDIWAHPNEESAELRAPSPSPGNERLAVRVEVECGSPPLANASNKIWKESLGNFPNGEWVQMRHALVHLRAPLLSAAALEQVRLASEVFAPRLLEALLRIHEGRPMDWDRVVCEEWLTWQSRSPWRREDRSPWTNESTLSDLERWLRLRL